MQQRLYLAAMCIMAAVITVRAATELSPSPAGVITGAPATQAASQTPQSGYVGLGS